MVEIRVPHTNGAYEIDADCPQLALIRNLQTLKKLREEYDRLEELRRPFSGRCYDCRCKVEAAEKAYEKAKRSLFGKSNAQMLEAQLSQLQQETAAAKVDLFLAKTNAQLAAEEARSAAAKSAKKAHNAAIVEDVLFHAAAGDIGDMETYAAMKAADLDLT